jgi:hypothetical protein
MEPVANAPASAARSPCEYLHCLFTKLPTVSAPNAGQFTPAAYAALRTQGAPLAAVA